MNSCFSPFPAETEVRWVVLRRERLRRKNQKRMPARTARAARPTPTPMPIVAPEERPLSDDDDDGDGEGEEAGDVEFEVFEPSASALLLLDVLVPVGTLAPASICSWSAIFEVYQKGTEHTSSSRRALRRLRNNIRVPQIVVLGFDLEQGFVCGDIGSGDAGVRHCVHEIAQHHRSFAGSQTTRTIRCIVRIHLRVLVAVLIQRLWWTSVAP